MLYIYIYILGCGYIYNLQRIHGSLFCGKESLYISLSILKWGDYPWIILWAQCNYNGPQKWKKETVVVRERCDSWRTHRKKKLLVLTKRKEAAAKEGGTLSKTGNNSLLQPCWHLDARSRRLLLDFWPLQGQIINSHCFQSWLWYYITAVIRNSEGEET